MTHRHRRTRTHGQTAFRLLRFQRQKLQTLKILTRVLTKLRQKTIGRYADQHLRPVEPSQFQVTVRRNHTHVIRLILHNRQVQSPPAEIKHQQLLSHRQFCKREPLLSQHMTQRRRHGLVDHLNPLQPRRMAGQQSRMALRIPELCRYRDHRFPNLTDLILSGCDELPQDHPGNMNRRITRIPHLPVLPGIAHESLGMLHNAIR